jgi:hypothetical protein
MEVFNKSGELCKKSGMKFGYHNHDFEFSESLNGKKLFDIILENTDPSLVAQQLDVGNMYGAGGRALDIFKKYGWIRKHNSWKRCSAREGYCRRRKEIRWYKAFHY